MQLLVDKAYLMVTTRCNVNCRYCIVRKTDEDMDEATIRQAIEFVVGTAGDDKKVAIYGGEPLVRLPLVETVVRHVAEVATAAGRPVTTYVYTNGLALTGETARWLCDHDVRVVLSLDASQELRPLAERTPEHQRTFAARLRHASEFLALAGPERVCAASVLLPSEIDALLPIYRYLTDSVGFTVVKVLPGLVRYRWTEDEVERFGRALDDLFRHVLRELRAGRELFLDSVNDALLRTDRRFPTDAAQVSVIEVYPGGAFGLSPCEFEAPDGLDNVNDIPHLRLGSVYDVHPEDVVTRVRAIGLPRHRGLLRLSLWSENVARWLVSRAPRNPMLARYVEHALERVFA